MNVGGDVEGIELAVERVLKGGQGDEGPGVVVVVRRHGAGLALDS